MTNWDYLLSFVKCVLKDKRSNLFFVTCIGAWWLAYASLHPHLPSDKHPIRLYSNHFHHDLKRVFIEAISKAKKSITLQIYGLSDPDILTLLQKRRAEGISVTIFYDKSGSAAIPISLGAIPIKGAGLMHRKILVVDEELSLVGSTNLTTQSLKMHDNVVLAIKDKELSTFFTQSSEEQKTIQLQDATLTSYLLPSKEALDALCLTLDGAEQSIKIAMFTITHPEIVQTLIAAKKRGIDVALAIDQYTAVGASKEALSLLKKSGITLYTSSGSQLLHHKWALVDDKTLILGSANWTASAFEKNQDSLIILKNFKKNLTHLWRSIAIACEKQ